MGKCFKVDMKLDFIEFIVSYFPKNAYTYNLEVCGSLWGAVKIPIEEGQGD